MQISSTMSAKNVLRLAEKQNRYPSIDCSFQPSLSFRIQLVPASTAKLTAAVYISVAEINGGVLAYIRLFAAEDAVFKF